MSILGVVYLNIAGSANGLGRNSNRSDPHSRDRRRADYEAEQARKQDWVRCNEVNGSDGADYNLQHLQSLIQIEALAFLVGSSVRAFAVQLEVSQGYRKAERPDAGK